MEKRVTSSREVWATRFLEIAALSMAGYCVLFIDFSGQGRLWDHLAARLAAAAGTKAPGLPASRRMAVVAEEVAADRTLVVADAAAAAKEPPSLSATSFPTPSGTARYRESSSPSSQGGRSPFPEGAPAAPRPRLTSALRVFDICAAGQHTSASVSAAPAFRPQAAAAAPAKSVAAPTGAVAIRAGYGAASRSEVMGQAAGPVYNLTGRAKRR